MAELRFEWDERKSTQNRRKHGVSFEEAQTVFFDEQALLAAVPNPYFGQIPASSSLGGPTITQQQLLRAYPRFTTVALFRDNVGNSSYHALQAMTK